MLAVRFQAERMRRAPMHHRSVGAIQWAPVEPIKQQKNMSCRVLQQDLQLTLAAYHKIIMRSGNILEEQLAPAARETPS